MILLGGSEWTTNKVFDKNVFDADFRFGENSRVRIRTEYDTEGLKTLAGEINR